MTVSTTTAPTTGTIDPLGVVVNVGDDNNNEPYYRLRPFHPDRDMSAVARICRGVYGGRDYLPKTASTLANDPLSNFLVLAACRCGVGEGDDDDRPVALANARTLIAGKMAWLEAVRTDAEYRGQGLARRLTEALIEQSRELDNEEIYTCTVASNTAMRKVFAKVGMQELNRIHQCSFSTLINLPGWAAAAKSTTRPVQQPLLQALNLESKISASAKSQTWESVSAEAELDYLLGQIRSNGGMGYMPGLYELVAAQTVQESLRQGLVWKLQGSHAAEAFSSSTENAIFAFYREEKIQSLHSQWVCSIAATSCEALEGALWKACSESCLRLLGDDVGFTVSIDGAVPIEDNEATPFAAAFPLVEDPCLLFGTAPLV